MPQIYIAKNMNKIKLYYLIKTELKWRRQRRMVEINLLWWFFNRTKKYWVTEFGFSGWSLFKAKLTVTACVRLNKCVKSVIK
jgi:hypothetical protein